MATVFSITNHMVVYKTTSKSYMQYIIIYKYNMWPKVFSATCKKIPINQPKPYFYKKLL